MKYSYIFFFIPLFFFFEKSFAQNDFPADRKINFPSHTITFPIDFDIKFRMLILEAKDSFLLVTPDKNWKQIKGLPKDLTFIQPYLKPLVGEKEVIYKYPYQDFESLKIETIALTNGNKKRVSQGAIIGGASGLGTGLSLFLLTNWAHSIGCEYDCNDGPKLVNFLGGGILAGGLIGTIIGHAASFKTTISSSTTVAKATNREWKAALREFSILR